MLLPCLHVHLSTVHGARGPDQGSRCTDVRLRVVKEPFKLGHLLRYPLVVLEDASRTTLHRFHPCGSSTRATTGWIDRCCFCRALDLEHYDCNRTRWLRLLRSCCCISYAFHLLSFTLSQPRTNCQECNALRCPVSMSNANGLELRSKLRVWQDPVSAFCTLQPSRPAVLLWSLQLSSFLHLRLSDGEGTTKRLHVCSTVYGSGAILSRRVVFQSASGHCFM